MKGAASAIALMMVSVACRPDMFNQPKFKPLSSSDFYKDGASARPPVPNTIARGYLDEDAVLFSGKIGTNLTESFPVPLTLALMERGRERFDIYCAICHGRTGDGNGVVVTRGFPAPPSLHIPRLREAPIGHFYDVISRGYGVMYSYANHLEPADRWAVAAYIRALQLSHNATLDDVPSNARALLEAPKP